MNYTATYFAAAAGAGDVDRYVESVDMKVGAYILANTTPHASGGARKVTCTRTVVGAADTPGTLVVVGKSLAGQVITETLTVGAHTVLVTGTKLFASITSITGAGWVIGEANDTITVGMAAAHYVAEGQGTLHASNIGYTAASAINVIDGTRTIAVLKASIPEGVYNFDVQYTSGLRVEPQGASKVTIVHSPSSTLTYAMS
jgi:hypothetical protein